MFQRRWKFLVNHGASAFAVGMIDTTGSITRGSTVATATQTSDRMDSSVANVNANADEDVIANASANASHPPTSSNASCIDHEHHICNSQQNKPLANPIRHDETRRNAHFASDDHGDSDTDVEDRNASIPLVTQPLAGIEQADDDEQLDALFDHGEMRAARSYREPSTSRIPGRGDEATGLRRFPSRGTAMSQLSQQRQEKYTSELSEDSFSFLITANVRSVPYCTALGVLFLKLSIFSLIVVGLVDRRDPSNPLAIPASVSTVVAISQFLALFITVASQDDVITSLTYMFEGYQPEMGKLFDTNPLKWVFGVASLFVTGAVGLIVTFLLIIASGEVVDLILNFTAMEFVTLLDNVAFALALAGFLGEANQKEALLVSNTHYDIPKSRQKSPIHQIVFLVSTFVVLMAGWATVYALQVRGVFLPQFVVVQFDDTLSPEMGSYSGIYSLRNDPWKGQFNRIYYWAEDDVATFAYCKDIRSWTFSVADYDHPCLNFLAKSSPTDNFDLSESGSDQWYATGDSAQPRFFPMDNFYLSVGCSQDDDCGGPGHGTCVEDRCECSRKFYGIRCDYEESETCERIELESGEFRGNGGVFPREYQLLKKPNGEIVKQFHHAVYTSIPGPGEDIAVMIYVGIRWALLYATNGFSDLNSNTRTAATRDDLVEYFESGNLKPDLSLKRIEFMSERVLFNTASDEATPKGLQWSIVRGDSPAAIEFVGVSNAVLLCAVCNNATNPCLNGNVCINGSCVCTNGEGEGRLCQITPLSNGRCDPYFNEAAFNFDGGDCCEATCVSTPEHVCGTQAYSEGTLKSANAGFPSCFDDAILSGEGAAWATKSFDIPFLSPMQKGLVILSANGRMVVSAEPILDVVRVFDQVDSRWEQRGPLLEGPRSSQFGRKIALSTPPGAVAGRRFGKVPVSLAIAYRGDTYAAVKVVFWQPNDINWGRFPELHVCQNSYPKNCDIQSMDIGQSGLGVTLAVGLTDGTIGIYRNMWIGNGSTAWNKTGEVNGTFVTLSGNGDLFAVRSPNHGIVDIYKQPFGSAPELSPYGGLNVSEKSQLLELAGALDQIRLSNDGSVLGVAIYGTGENDYLAVFSLDVGGFTRSEGWTMTKFASLSEEDVAKGLSSVFFSGDGNAAAVRVNSSTGRIVRLYQHRLAFGWSQLGADFVGHANEDLDADFSISHDGSQLAYGDVGHASTFALIPRCNADEALFRISITHDDFPSYVTWTLKYVLNVGNLMVQERVLRACYNCYNDTDIYGRTNIVENVCIANDRLSCVRFVFRNEMGFQEGAGFAAFLRSSEVARYDGIGTDPIVWMPSEPSSSVCGQR